MSAVLVTGGNGFIGRMLCSHLLNMGHSVSAIVRSIDKPIAGIDYIVADLEADTLLPRGTLKVDCLYHLAGRAHILNQPVQGALEKFRQANCEATVRLATQALADGVKRFVFVSSIGVNGARSERLPFGEHSLPSPHADYAVSKWEAEQALRRLLCNGVMELVVVRPPLVYAANAPGNFARLLRLVSKGLPLPFAMVHNRRSMVSLKNLVHFLELCGEHPRAPGHTFFPSDGEDVSTAEIVRYLGEGMQRRVVLFPVPAFLARWAADLVGRRSLYTQLYGSLQIEHKESSDVLGWRACETTSDALRQAGREFMSSLQ